MYYLTIMARYRWYSNPSPVRNKPLSVAALAVRERMAPIFVDRPKGLEHYLFIHFHDPVEIWLNGTVSLQPKHTFVIWPPGTKHYFGHARRRWNHTWMY